MPRRRLAGGERELHRLIDEIYAAATDTTRWPDVLEHVRTFLHLMGVSLVHTGAQRGGVCIASAGLDPTSVEEYPRWAEHDAMSTAGLRTGPDVVINSAELMPDTEYERSVFYSEFLRRYGLYHVAGCSLLSSYPGTMTSLGLHRPRPRPFEHQDLERFRLLTPHLKRAFEVHSRLARAERRELELTEALDRLRMGAVLLDTRGRILLANRAARQIEAQRDGLYLDAGGIRGATPTVTSRVREAVAAALEPVCLIDSRSGVVRMPRPSGRRAYRFLVAPLSRHKGSPILGESEAVAIAFLSDPDRSIDARPELVEELLGVTPAEARVTLELAHGATTAEVASALGIQVNTVRAHLKSVFSKTGTRSQPQLLERLFAVLPPSRLN